jgi:hypothetical protein
MYGPRPWVVEEGFEAEDVVLADGGGAVVYKSYY